ncbi:GNAT family N-acetyltransferase [Novosphingobium cyanobacteriorum]|uniref:N-acetyltransferase n=1 Tax=Novosphingobium cyanobacteriorum TaxID=3024215 RepID=A0ABT6CI02_9SPHN|nr:N-acetyltransferase [Novosphingobium cyanobacteriorum]MDF8333421.1 N-acetyltransferase [Novosphingobium cyanobacteriorum]
MHIRPARTSDHDAIWRILQPVIRAGETYALDRNLTRAAALAYWFAPGNSVFVVQDGTDAVIGTYYLRANQQGGGRHVANCGYMVAPEAGGQGVARAMCGDSLGRAKARGFRAMQFNFVVSTNARAVGLWQACGFAIVGRIPLAFDHPSLGLVDALVMHRSI